MRDLKTVIGSEYVSNGRRLSLSRAVRAGDYVFLTGQIPRIGDKVVTTGNIEDQTRIILERIKETLAEANCGLENIVKAMVWLRDRSDFAGFNETFGEYFPVDPPARSAVVNELLLDVRVEVEVIAYKPA